MFHLPCYCTDHVFDSVMFSCLSHMFDTWIVVNFTGLSGVLINIVMFKLIFPLILILWAIACRNQNRICHRTFVWLLLLSIDCCILCQILVFICFLIGCTESIETDERCTNICHHNITHKDRHTCSFNHYIMLSKNVWFFFYCSELNVSDYPIIVDWHDT